MEILGFTGTREGMTSEQIGTVDNITAFEFDEVHHGDCIGADHDMHRIARANGQRLIGHPPEDPSLRAFCNFDDLLDPKPYLERDRDIVDMCDVLIATPKESVEVQKGGTWYTVRYARSKGKKIIIVWPDGSVRLEVARLKNDS